MLIIIDSPIFCNIFSQFHQHISKLCFILKIYILHNRERMFKICRIRYCYICKFHEIIYSGTGNQKLMQILSNLREQMYRYRLEYIKDANKRQILLVEHEQILKALSLRHVQEARLAVREHIDNQEITVLKNLKEQEENDVQRKVSGRRNRVRGD